MAQSRGRIGGDDRMCRRDRIEALVGFPLLWTLIDLTLVRPQRCRALGLFTLIGMVLRTDS